MARRLRLEFPGAIYHVINRGNYRSWIFRDPSAKRAFEACLFEACERADWVLHAFVLMGNHYHLALETPRGNLANGMQWLQSTFANRFNRLRGEHGHLFQGRFRALLVEAGDALGQVCHYQHLNPVRAGLVACEDLAAYRYSSYWYLARPKRRPSWLRVESALQAAGQLPDTAAGRASYAAYLAWQAAEGPAGKNAAYVRLTRGWAIGGETYKQRLLREYAVSAESRAWESSGVLEVKRARWQAALDSALARLPAEGRKPLHQSAPWKIAVAAHLKATTDAPNSWLATKLAMGSPGYLSKHVSAMRAQPGGLAARWLAALQEVYGKA